MTDAMLLWPLLMPLLTAVVSLFFWQQPRAQKVVFLVGILATLGLATALLAAVWSGRILTLQAGDWPAPFGITLVADIFSAVMVWLTALLGLLIFVYSLQDINATRKRFGFYPMLLFLIFGLCGTFLTGDVFNLYVWFEVMLVSSFVLMTIGGDKEQMEGSIKYVTINFLSSALFLAGIGVLYGITGTLNMANLALRLPQVPDQGLVTIAAVFFFISFGVKAALFPLYFWLPASYHTPPTAITAMIGGLLTKVGVYTMLRFFTLVFPAQMDVLQPVVWLVAILTMVSGVLGAVAQNDMSKIFSFSIISQIGYTMMGLAIYTPLGIAGAIFFVIHNVLVKTNLFLITGLVRRLNRSLQLSKMGGVYRDFPVVAFAFVVSGFALSGVPPLSGFWGKFMLVRAALVAEEYVLVAVALGVSVFTFFYVTKTWNEVFWKQSPREAEGIRPLVRSQRAFLTQARWLVLPVAVFTALILAVSFYVGPVVALAQRAADQLLRPADYIEAVLGEGTAATNPADASLTAQKTVRP